MSIFTDIWGFLKKIFVSATQSADSLAVVVTQHIKTALDSGVVGFIATLIDGLTKSKIAEDVVDLLKATIPKILAVELAIEGIPNNPTADDILAFEKRVLAAFNITSDNSQLYSSVAANLFREIQEALADNKMTFAEALVIAEETFQKITNPQAVDTDPADN